LVCLACVVALAVSVAGRAQSGGDDVPVPRYEIDPFWPKPLPNNWLMKDIPRVAVDQQDRVWIITRGEEITPAEAGLEQDPPTALCCRMPPTVMAFDQEGNLVYAWGKKDGYLPNGQQMYRRRVRALALDGDGNVWVGGNNPGDTLLQFTPDGKFLREFGRRGPVVPGNQQKPDNQQTEYLVRGPTNPTIDPETGELYIDDVQVNKRILVYDLATGAFKRGWGGHGIPLSDIDNDPIPPFDPAGPPRKHFTPTSHCAKISQDRLVYVCNRGGDSIQVFTTQGEFVKEFFLYRSTADGGQRIFDVVFSHDPQQKYMFVSDGTNGVIWILQRDDGAIVGSVGRKGRMAGELYVPNGIAVDSQGNLYVGEVGGAGRVQKFVLQ
jgi:DNA-binding beta-propeller fold protein YncE